MMSTATQQLIPFVHEDNSNKETIKWAIGNSKYEVSGRILESMEIKDLLPHCMLIHNKVTAQVTTQAHVGPSLYRAFSRSLSIVLQSIWDQVNDDANADAAIDNTETADHFDDRLRDFIAVHSTAEDRHELVQQLRGPSKKPCKIPVQSFWYRMRELNGYAQWLPGNEPVLTEDQLKQAFYDAMPSAWQERFINSGGSVATKTMAELVRYFRKQEALAVKKMQENQKEPKKDKGSAVKRTPKGTPKKTYKGNGDNKKRNTPPTETTKGKCPLHPDKDHPWEKCWQNIKNTDSPLHPNNKNKKQKTQGSNVNEQTSEQHVNETPAMDVGVGLPRTRGNDAGA